MNKLEKLKKLFKIYNIDGYLVPKNDEFFGEYANIKYDRLNYISNFSGSAGYALILKQKSYLFVDGRYTLQAKKEADKSFKIINIHTNKPSELIFKHKKKIKIGFDPRLFSEHIIIKIFQAKNATLVPIEKNLIDSIWLNKPSEKIKKFFILNTKDAGKKFVDKINIVCKILKKENATKLLITSPENIAWILNIRGQDSKFSPVPNCHAILDYKKKITLIVDERKISRKFRLKFKNYLSYINPSDIHRYFKNLNNNTTFLIDKFSCSFYYKKQIKKKFRFIEKIDPIFFLKAKKNKVEINNFIKSHILDGVALTKFIYWIKKNINKLKITEVSAKNKLEEFRKQNISYKFPSFNTISSAGPNGAIVHYKVNNKTNRLIKKKDIYLCDSGGQYHYGTTDVTRTICFSRQPKRIINIFTKVLKGHINVATYQLNKKTTGEKIDKVARAPLKKIGLNYDHSTGHGVGYFSNVHEGPQAISKSNKIKLTEGMILSNEPGFYKTNEFGIRIENLIFIKKNKKKLKFENLTLAPIEKNLIDFSLLNKKETKYLYNYHKKVYYTLSPYLKNKEKIWLRSFFQ
tara:strand:- start:5381 stop:7105 length:1725 start_codon:yes stop_codon:yes gene_type:complete